MPTHPLWRPFELVDLDEVAKVRVGGARRDPSRWCRTTRAGRPSSADSSDRVRAALGDRVLALEHVGSTAVPGLAAKPVIDADLTVADSGDEAAYVPDLEAAGFVLRVREPEWEEHRVLAARGRRRPTCTSGRPAAPEPQRHARLPRLAAHPRRRPRRLRRAQDRARRPRVRRRHGLQQPQGRAGLRHLRADLRRGPGARARPAAAADWPSGLEAGRDRVRRGPSAARCGRRDRRS